MLSYMKEPSDTAVTAWRRLVSTQHMVLSAVEADLKAAGFPPLAWYDVLLELSREPTGCLRPFQIEERILLAQYNLSRLLTRLERAGYVARESCEEDNRGNLVRITDKGASLRRRMWPAYGAAISRRIGDHLSEREAAHLAKLLDKLQPVDAP